VKPLAQVKASVFAASATRGDRQMEFGRNLPKGPFFNESESQDLPGLGRERFQGGLEQLLLFVANGHCQRICFTWFEIPKSSRFALAKLSQTGASPATLPPVVDDAIPSDLQDPYSILLSRLATKLRLFLPDSQTNALNDVSGRVGTPQRPRQMGVDPTDQEIIVPVTRQ